VKAIEVGPVTIEIAAPPGLVFQMLAAIGQGPQKDDERVEIIEERDGEVICDFWTRVPMPIGQGRSVRTRERVRVTPPDRIDFEHLDGPVRGLRETILVGGSGGSSVVTYTGTYQPRGIADRLGARLLARPIIRGIVRAHFADVRDRAEARAGRSRVFAVDETAG
jgi:hypothetical protein